MCNVRKSISFFFVFLFCFVDFAYAQKHANQTVSKKNTWKAINYKGNSWVRNLSQPNEITRGLLNRHLSLWSSHGRYYDQKTGKWKWQRPLLFSTSEDLYTQTIVLPYLIPMLQNAGAVVFTPRERDWQKNEIIVDNDISYRPNYYEIAGAKQWQTTSIPGFSMHSGNYVDG